MSKGTVQVFTHTFCLPIFLFMKVFKEEILTKKNQQIEINRYIFVIFTGRSITIWMETTNYI